MMEDSKARQDALQATDQAFEQVVASLRQRHSLLRAEDAALRERRTALAARRDAPAARLGDEIPRCQRTLFAQRAQTLFSKGLNLKLFNCD